MVGIPVPTADSSNVKILSWNFPLDLQNLDIRCYFCYHMVMEEQRVTHSVKIKLSILRRGKIAAVSANKSLGQWLEEAILEKTEREGKLSKEGQR